MKGVTIVGSYNVGLFLKGSRLPAIGETVIADEFLESGGGKGSNQAVAASMLGAPVSLIARIGSDAYGRDALAMYDRLGIAADGIIVDETIHSGVSVILIDAAGNNLISVVPGANLTLSNQDLDRFDEVFRNSAIVGFQLENDRDLVRYCLRVGPQFCARISENISTSPGLSRRFQATPRCAYHHRFLLRLRMSNNDSDTAYPGIFGSGIDGLLLWGWVTEFQQSEECARRPRTPSPLTRASSSVRPGRGRIMERLRERRGLS